jgi:hypothetical protein
MNTLNRVIMIIILLVIMVSLAVGLLVPAVAPEPVMNAVVNYFGGLKAGLLLIDPALRLALAVMMIILIWIIAGSILWMELKPPSAHTVKLQQMQGGVAELTLSSISQQVDYYLAKVPDVLRARSNINKGRKGIDVRLELETNPEIVVPAKTAEVRDLVNDVVERRLGLQLSSLHITIKHAPYSKIKGLYQPPKPAALTEKAPGESAVPAGVETAVLIPVKENMPGDAAEASGEIKPLPEPSSAQVSSGQEKSPES